jgi:DNA-binding HxlR family transcriptional regulator
MRGYGQYCPVALGAEIFAERWTPIVIRNLMIGCERFGEILEGAPGMPRSVLTQRLRRLTADGVVERRQVAGTPTYRLTPAGAELGEVCLALGAWGARWRDAGPRHRDPYLALWMLARLIRTDELAQDRVVVRFDLTDRSRPNHYWLIAARSGNEICAQHPGFEEHAVMTTDAEGLIGWHTGRLPLAAACRSGRITIVGPRWARTLLTDWGRLSPFAGVARAGASGPGTSVRG